MRVAGWSIWSWRWELGWMDVSWIVHSPVSTESCSAGGSWFVAAQMVMDDKICLRQESCSCLFY